MIVGVPKEICPGERRVAVVPAHLASLQKAGIEVVIEAGAGAAAGFLDAQYEEKRATVVADRAAVFSKAEVVLQVRTLGAAGPEGRKDLDLLEKGKVVVGLAEPLSEPDAAKEYASRGVALLALELMPRITRAQAMDVLSSSASIVGYKAVLLAAGALPKIFPMMMTAAGTIAPAKILVIGAGVAGLQAIATAKRLGGVVSAYDVRPVVKEQVESLGAKFVELEIDTKDAEGAGGYAKEQTAEQLEAQRKLMAKVIAESDVVISTAAVPGKKAPILVTEEMVRGMSAGSVIVDVAAERGGNCELTKAGETVEAHGVTILGPVNLAATVPTHSSQTFSKNVTTYLLHLVKEGKLVLDREDEITAATLVTHEGEVVHPAVREAAGLGGSAS